MAVIKLDLSELSDMRIRILRIKGDAESYYNEVSKVAQELNIKIRAKQEIVDMLTNIKTMLQKEIKYLENLANVINECIDEFAAKEKIDKLPDLWVTTKILSDSRIVGGVSDLLVEKEMHEVSDLTTLFSNNESNASVLNLADYDALAKYFKSK